MSGNGGFVGGEFSALLEPGEGAAQATLRAPIPLDESLQVNKSVDQLTITNGDTLIAEVERVEFDLDIPEHPAWEDVEAAAPSSYSFMDSIMPIFEGRKGFHPICFCCGAEHEDGLEVFAAPVGDQVAAIWNTREDWADEEGNIPESFLWAAMDCPGQFAYMAKGIITGMLGRITARVHKTVKAGETLMVTAWPITVEGKKHFAGSAVFDKSGNLIAETISVWIGRREM